MKRRLALTALLVLLGSTLIVQEAPATVLTSGNSIMEIDATSQDGIFSWVVDGVEHMFQQWFWFRTSPTAPEASLDTLAVPVEVSAGNSAEFTFTGTGLTVFVSYGLFGGAAGSGDSSLGEFVLVTNTGTSPIALSWFEYTDYDLSDGAGGDTATAGGTSGLTQTDAFTTAGIGAGPPATHFEVDFFSATLDLLNDAAPTTLSDGTVPLGPGDITHALQWDVTLGPGDSLGIEKSKFIDSSLVAVPVPPTLILLGGALIIGAVASRSRRRS